MVGDRITDSIIEDVPTVVRGDDQVNGGTRRNSMCPLHVKTGFARPRFFAMVLEWVVHRASARINDIQHRVGQSKYLVKYVQVLADGGAAIGVDDHDGLSRSIEVR